MYAPVSSVPVPHSMAAASAEPELELTALPTPLSRDEVLPGRDPQSPTAGIAIRELTAGIDGIGDGSDIHVLVVQPDGRLHVGVDIEKWAAVGKLREPVPETSRQVRFSPFSDTGISWRFSDLNIPFQVGVGLKVDTKYGSVECHELFCETDYIPALDLSLEAMIASHPLIFVAGSAHQHHHGTHTP